MKDFLRKITSRKFLACIAGLASGVALAYGADAETVQTISGAAMSIISILTYVIAEGKIDAAAIKQTVEVIDELVDDLTDDDYEEDEVE